LVIAFVALTEKLQTRIKANPLNADKNDKRKIKTDKARACCIAGSGLEVARSSAGLKLVPAL
jgi:hypothetical protein